MKRRRAIFLFISLLCVFIAAFCSSCSKSDGAEPVLTDIAVDVTDRPEAFFVGDYKVKSIKVNGSALSEEKYIVKNGYFIFAMEYYGELGTGDNVIEIEFEQGVKQFKISINDSVMPIYTLPEKTVYLYSATEQVRFPMANKAVIWQNFDIKYSLYLGQTEQFTETNPQADDINRQLNAGLYKLKIDVSKGQNVIDSAEYDIYVNKSENFITENKFADIKYEKSALNVDYDEASGGLKIYKKTQQYGIESRLGFDYADIKAAIDDGATYLCFRYYSENGFFFDKDASRYLDLSVEYWKFNGAPSFIGNVADVSVNPEEGTSGEWQTAIIPITGNDDADRLCFSVFACPNDYFYLKDMYMLYPSDALISLNYYSSINYAASKYYGSWQNTGITMEYDDAEQAIKLTKLGVGISGNHSHIDMPIMDEIRVAKAAGMAMISFEYSAKNIVGTGANNPVIWVMATDGNVETIGSACWIVNPIDIVETADGEWNKAVVPLDRAIVDDTAYKYFVILVGGEQDGVVELKNIKYGDADDYDACVKSIQILTLQASATVPMGETVDLEYSFTNLDGSAYVGDAGFVWTSSDESVATVSATGRVAAVSSGNTTITLSALDGKYTVYCTVTVNSIDYSSINYAASKYYGNWQNTGITMEYVDAEQAIKLTKQGVGISGSHSHIEIEKMDEIRAAKAAGMAMISFEYSAKNIVGTGANNPVIWVMATDGKVETIGSACWIVNPIDIVETADGEWNKVVFTLDRAIVDNTAYKYFVILVGGEQDGVVELKNIKYGDADEYHYRTVNYASPTYVAITDANSIGLEFDSTENAMKITKQYAGLSGSHSHVRMPVMDDIRAAKQSGLGFEKLTLEYKANEGDLLWIMCNDGSDESVGSSCWLVGAINVDESSAGQWHSVEIDLNNALIDVETNEYLMFLSGGQEIGGSIYIRNIKLA